MHGSSGSVKSLPQPLWTHLAAMAGERGDVVGTAVSVAPNELDGTFWAEVWSFDSTSLLGASRFGSFL